MHGATAVMPQIIALCSNALFNRLFIWLQYIFN